jgi:5-oxoprolinase (ATP-hydrolysing)
MGDGDDEDDGTASLTPTTKAMVNADYVSKFVAKYKREYGFTLDRKVLVDDVRVRAIASTKSVSRTAAAPTPKSAAAASSSAAPRVEKVYFDGGWLDTRVYTLSSLANGERVSGPAMLINNTSTILVVCPLSRRRF